MLRRRGSVKPEEDLDEPEPEPKVYEEGTVEYAINSATQAAIAAAQAAEASGSTRRRRKADIEREVEELREANNRQRRMSFNIRRLSFRGALPDSANWSANARALADNGQESRRNTVDMGSSDNAVVTQL